MISVERCYLWFYIHAAVLCIVAADVAACLVYIAMRIIRSVVDLANKDRGIWHLFVACYLVVEATQTRVMYNCHVFIPLNPVLKERWAQNDD